MLSIKKMFSIFFEVHQLNEGLKSNLMPILKSIASPAL